MAVIICPIIVASAAPFIPYLKEKINMGSKIILIRALKRVEIIAKRGFPSTLIIGFKACPNI